jgi:hypothetical protein
LPPWLRQIFGVVVPPPVTVRASPTRPRRRRRRSEPDFQRARVYRWEQAHVLPLAPSQLELAACRALVLEAYRWAEAGHAGQAGWKPPEVTDGRGRRHACGSREVIKLPRWARTRPIVLHECAHGLAPDKHGPRFVAVYVDLLERFMGLDKEELLRTLGTAKIKVAGQRGSRRNTAQGRAAGAGIR